MRVKGDGCLLSVLKTIATGELKDGTNVEWMSIWDVGMKSGYSQGYTHAVICSLYWDHQALIRMQDGLKFVFRVSAKGEDLLQQWCKEQEGR